MDAKRVIRVTSTLLAMGAVAGGACAVVIVLLMLVAAGGSGVGELFTLETAALLARIAVFGALVGAIGWPALAWGLLRRVPLGKAMAWTALGAVVGAVAGEMWAPFNPYSGAIPGILQGACAGFLGAGVMLRLTSGFRV